MKKMSKRKVLFLFAVTVLSALTITGCGKKKTETAATEPSVTCVDDLEGKKIGVQLGTTGDVYVSDYEGDDAGTVIERYNKGNDAVQALKQDKIDAVVIDEQPAKAFVESNSDIMILPEEFTNEDYAICVAKGNDALKEKINAALEELTQDGTLEKIKKNYVGEEDEKGKYQYQSTATDTPNGTLTVATNAQFKPYEYYDGGKITGLDMDMMQAVSDKLGMKLKIEDMEFDSIISAVSSGKADVGAAGMTVTEDRLKNIDFTNSYTNSKQVIIVKNPNATAVKQSISEKFKQNFVVDGRWEYLASGLKNTLVITVFAILIGVLLGFLVAIIRAYHDMEGGMKLLNAICQLYLTVVRGTPVMVQILIIYYIIFATSNVNKVIVGIIAFGLNSAAYVAEIVRSGIMSIDRGQFEAGRSLGLGYSQTMVNIILPQAIKNILPALGNEFIVLLKETSISGYIGLADLAKGGDIIRSITYEPFMPLVAVALIYLAIVLLLSKGVSVLERRLRASER